MLNVAVITTVNHNVGDDFVREGILYLLEKAIGPIQSRLIHKHLPLTVRPEWEWFYRYGISRVFDHIPKISGLRFSQLIDWLPLNPHTDKILKCDLLVQSGAPVYWLHQAVGCANNEWFGPLVRRRWQKVRQRVPFLNIAGGSCQEYYSDGREFAESPKTLAYIREFYQMCALTTVRDELSRKILQLIEIDGVVLPCPSIFARKRLRLEVDSPSYVALNYMSGGGHYAFSQQIDAAKWAQTFRAFATELARQEDCVLVCHNQHELQLAKKLLPQLPVFYSDKYTDYVAWYAKAKYGIFNRVHGAFALASFGRPSIIVGADSRARMADVIGLQSFFVNDVSEELLWQEQARLKAKSDTYSDAVFQLQAQAESAYLKAIRNALRE